MLTKQTTLAVAARDFFGLLPGTGLKDFLVEWKSLTDADKAEIRDGLAANSYVIVDTPTRG